jgi:hypothetical protein
MPIKDTNIHFIILIETPPLEIVFLQPMYILSKKDLMSKLLSIVYRNIPKATLPLSISPIRFSIHNIDYLIVPVSDPIKIFKVFCDTPVSVFLTNMIVYSPKNPGPGCQ